MLWSINSCQNRDPLTSITWPYRGLRNRPIEYFLKLSADNLLVFKWSQAQVHFLKYRRNKLSRTIKILISNWTRTLKFSQLLQTGKTVAFDVSHHGHALVTLYVQFLCSDWSKLTGEFMWRIYAPWNLFTLTAEADRVLWQLVMFLTAFFHWMYNMKFSCYQESSVIHG